MVLDAAITCSILRSFHCCPSNTLTN